MWLGPRFKARILYPRLCQSMMTLLPSSVPASHTKGRVGMLGGFFTNLLCYLVTGSQQTHLHEDKLRRMGYSPEESM